MIHSPLRFLWLFLIVFSFSACGEDVPEVDEQPLSITARIPSEPDRLNPATTFHAYSRVINEQLFQALLQFDPETLELVPQLATGRAEIEEITAGPLAGGVAYTFELRPEAKWDDGQPITAEDVAFSVKVMLHPDIAPPPLRPYYDYFKELEIDPDNPKRFTIRSNNKYMLAEAALGTTSIQPAHIYDPEGIMAQYSIADLSDSKKAAELVETNPELADFALSFTSTERSREPSMISGSGPYRLEEWVTEQYLRLTRKESWWADELAGAQSTLEAYPKELNFRIITDQTSATSALQSGEVEVASQIDSRDFVRFREDTSFTNRFNLFTPLAFQIYYIGFNTRIPKLRDPKVRRALAHALDVDQVIEKLYAGLAERIAIPFHPSQPSYHHDLPLIKYDPEKAKALLQEAGWEDTNQNGTVDKVINEQRQEMTLRFLTSTNSRFSQDLALFYKNALAPIGVELVIEAKEFNAIREDFGRLDFDVFSGAWSQDPLPQDPKQLWSTEAAVPGGGNRMGFGNAESDRLIEQIRTTLDADLRNQMMLQFQEMIYDAQPGIFLFSPQERIVISNKYDAKATPIRPGFFLNEFKLHHSN
ncbi:MAG: ABC transporter substrate-binding protein [Saprospiraceae bacterium]|nr:hypothetical protein [Lewinella sp.]